MEGFAIDDEEDHIIVRINGGKSKCPDELKIIKNDDLKLAEVIR